MFENSEKPTGPEISLPAAELPLGAAVSALLFSAPRPVTLAALMEATGAEQEELDAVIGNLKAMYQETVHGFSLQEVAGGYQFRTTPLAAPYVTRLVPSRTKRLSRAAAETLAVIAYRQPVQRAEIEAIRGVDALPTLRTLLDARLIRMVGHDDAVGQPALYGTTDVFLERFGLRDLSELPSIRELEQVMSDPGESSPASEEDDSASGESGEMSAGT